MKVYRASNSSEIFAGAHFAEEFEEAAAYAGNDLAGTGDNFGGSVRCYEIDGEIFDAASPSCLVDWLIARVADEEIDVFDLGKIGAVIQDAAREAGFGNFWEGIELINHRDLDLQMRGWSYTFELIEECEEVIYALDDAGYNWIRFEEVSVSGDQSAICTTLRYLGGGSVELA